MSTAEERLQHAYSAQGDELWNLLRDPHPQVILNTILNRNLSEDMALFIAKRRNVPVEAIDFLANDTRFRDSLTLKLALCRNPKTPQRIVFSLLKFLKIFDLGDITRDRAVPITVRQKIELMITEKAASLPSGVKIALAKRSSANVILFLMEHGDRNVIRACLDSPVITETHLCTVINRSLVNPILIHLISEHLKWSLRYQVKYALIRNSHTPLIHVTRFIPEMITHDLRELYSSNRITASVKPYIYSELNVRSESIQMPEEEIFELVENDDIS